MYRTEILDEELEFNFDPTELVEAINGLYVAAKFVDNCVVLILRLEKMICMTVTRDGREILVTLNIALKGNTVVNVHMANKAHNLTNPIQVTKILQDICENL